MIVGGRRVAVGRGQLNRANSPAQHHRASGGRPGRGDSGLRRSRVPGDQDIVMEAYDACDFVESEAWLIPENAEARGALEKPEVGSRANPSGCTIQRKRSRPPRAAVEDLK